MGDFVELSIIVPIYNMEKFLNRCIESILGQRFKEFELILINDGSTDKSGEICRYYAAQDTRIKVIEQKNSGVSGARNKGLEVANGNYIGFVDPDDYVDKEMYDILMKCARQKNMDIIICDYRLLNICENRNEEYEDIIMNRGKAIKELLLGKKYSGFVWNKLYKRSLFNNTNFDVNVKIYEDLLINYELFIKANRIFYTSKKMYFYCYRKNSLSHENFSNKNIIGIDALKKLHYRVRKDYPEFSSITLYKWISRLIRGMVKLLLNRNIKERGIQFLLLQRDLRENFFDFQKNMYASYQEKFLSVILLCSYYSYEIILKLRRNIL